MLRSSLALALIASLALAACGGAGGGSDADKITKAIQNTAGISDASLCDSLFTDQGIQQTYSEDSPQAAHKDCLADAKAKQHDVQPGDVSVSNVQVNAGTATAVGAVKGQKGYFRLKKDGGDWKIDGVSDTPGGAAGSAQATTSTPAQTTAAAPANDPEVTKAEGSVLAWAKAGRNGDKYAFCGLESDGLLKRQTGTTGSAAVAACVKAFHPISSFPSPAQITFTKATVTGNRADVSLTAPGKGNTTTLSLVKAGDLWKIDSAH